MPNMSLKKVPMPEQEPNVRNHNFQEVSLGYTKEMAMEEAARCLNCKHKPCVGGCPVNIRIPEFIAKVAEGDFQAAYDIISDTNALPSVSGRVCPQESQCEARCVRAIKGEPVAIGRLERFVADWYRENVNAMPQKPQTNGIKVAVVGSGPASLTCASDLAKHGYEVTIFEAFHTAGGVLVYGIPEFRLPKAIVQNEVDKLTALGVDLETDMVIGKTFDIDEMFEEGYEAVFIGSGAGLPMFMGIEGETLAGVYSANEYLTRINLMKAYLPMDGVAMKTLFTVGSLLPAVGIAILLKQVATKPVDILVFVFGFTLAACMGLNLIAASIVGGFFAVINYRIKILALQKAAPAAASAAAAEFDDDEEEI